MVDWQQQFENMRALFISRAGERLDKILELLDQLGSGSDNQQQLATTIRQHFHWLSGTGGTYKIPEMSDLGYEGECLCDSHLQENSPLSISDIEQLRTLISRVRQQLEHGKTS
jgi:hypothetical protein